MQSIETTQNTVSRSGNNVFVTLVTFCKGPSLSRPFRSAFCILQFALCTCATALAQTPTFFCPNDTLVDCTSSTDPSVTDEPFDIQDDCGGIQVAYQDVRTNGNCAGTYVIRRTWYVSDMCGNT